MEISLKFWREYVSIKLGRAIKNVSTFFEKQSEGQKIKVKVWKMPRSILNISSNRLSYGLRVTYSVKNISLILFLL